MMLTRQSKQTLVFMVGIAVASSILRPVRVMVVGNYYNIIVGSELQEVVNISSYTTASSNKVVQTDQTSSTRYEEEAIEESTEQVNKETKPQQRPENHPQNLQSEGNEEQVPTEGIHQRQKDYLRDPSYAIGMNQDAPRAKKCALNFFGLPRAFASVVLPSIRVNILDVNAKYDCDIFVHYYEQSSELRGRSGRGGVINATAILALEQAAQEQAKKNGRERTPVVKFMSQTPEEFESIYTRIIAQIHTEDRLIHFRKSQARRTKKGEATQPPLNTSNITYKIRFLPSDGYHNGYTMTSYVNVIKMFHSTQSSFNLMERYEKMMNITYERVAMFRSDVFYITPIDIYSHGSTVKGKERAIIPGFAKFPVNDRMIYGPRAAVKIWAAERLQRMWKYMEKVNGLASEQFLAKAIFPAIRKELNIGIEEDASICFLRARADESIWIKDCGTKDSSRLYPPVIRSVLGRNCSSVIKVKAKKIWEIKCPSDENALLA